MRLAICNETYQDKSFDEVCRDVAECGYEALELAPFTLKEDPRELTEADALTLSRTASKHGLDILGLHWLLTKPTWFHITSPDALQRKETVKFGRHLARFCAMTGGRIMVWGSPKARSVQPEWDREECWKRAVEAVPVATSPRVTGPVPSEPAWRISMVPALIVPVPLIARVQAAAFDGLANQLQNLFSSP
jgi:sugar phosphate isomerase/epimerase